MAERPDPPDTSSAAALQPTANWQYQVLSRKSADVATALAANRLARILAGHLKAREIIGQTVYDQATNYAVGVTEYARVQHLVTAVLTKTKYNPQCYHDFIQILKLDGIRPDTEAACSLLPKAMPPTATTTSSSGREAAIMAEGNQPQKRNLAAEAFKRNSTALHDALAQPDVASGLATKLYNGAIIALETRDAVQMPSFTPAQQANWLLQAVESSIKIDHTRLRKFTRVLRKQPVLKPIAKQLRQCYRELVSEARLTESSSSGSDTNSTEQHQSQAAKFPVAAATGTKHAASPGLQDAVLRYNPGSKESSIWPNWANIVLGGARKLINFVAPPTAPVETSDSSESDEDCEEEEIQTHKTARRYLASFFYPLLSYSDVKPESWVYVVAISLNHPKFPNNILQSLRHNYRRFEWEVEYRTLPEIEEKVHLGVFCERAKEQGYNIRPRNMSTIYKCDVDIADCKAGFASPEASALYPPRIFLEVTADYHDTSKELECPLELIGTSQTCTFMLTTPKPTLTAPKPGTL